MGKSSEQNSEKSEKKSGGGGPINFLFPFLGLLGMDRGYIFVDGDARKRPAELTLVVQMTPP